MLEAAGFDALHVDAGCYESWYWPHPPIHQKHGCMVDMAARVKQVVNVPVIAVGRLDVPALAHQVVEENKADMVALGRGLLADPQWVAKVRSNQVDQIRPCLACYDGCFARYEGHRPISCAVNPASGRERDYRLMPTSDPKKIMVIGGGIAGMEFARVAAIRGHQVTLYEKGKDLGGTVVQAAVPPFKKDLRRLLAWYQRQMSHDRIQLRLETVFSLDILDEQKPDRIVVAVGAKPIMPPITGVNRGMVTSAVDLLNGKSDCGESAVIIGGGLVGCEIAIWLSQLGKKVTIVEMLSDVMTGNVFVPHQVRMMTLDLLKSFNVTMLNKITVREIMEQAVKVRLSDNSDQIIPADTVVLAAGMAADEALYQQLCQRFDSVYAIGDCRKARNVMNAIWDAYEVARSI
jgi:2-enoate reductase